MRGDGATLRGEARSGTGTDHQGRIVSKHEVRVPMVPSICFHCRGRRSCCLPTILAATCKPNYRRPTTLRSKLTMALQNHVEVLMLRWSLACRCDQRPTIAAAHKLVWGCTWTVIGSGALALDRQAQRKHRSWSGPTSRWSETVADGRLLQSVNVTDTA
jgi:hypothetical protein